MKIIIIEDEPVSARRLKNLLLEIDRNISILDCIDSIDNSVNWIKTHETPDLAFMDIQLSDGLAFEIFTKTEVKFPIIFITAYDEYALKAFEVNSIDYVLKPFDKKILEKSLEKYHNLKSQFSISDKIAALENTIKNLQNQQSLYKSRFLIKTGVHLITIFTTDIAYFQSDRKLTFLVTKLGKHYAMDESLDEIEHQVNPHEFFRINRQLITSARSITNIESYFNGKLKLELMPSTNNEVLVSREKAAAFKKWLNQ